MSHAYFYKLAIRDDSLSSLTVSQCDSTQDDTIRPTVEIVKEVKEVITHLNQLTSILGAAA